ncbi:MAG: hypothetical protein K2X38_10195 [Gemmataceae bacterium]|nr:hypothetical protein [Gemmataceae bacterium]
MSAIELASWHEAIRQIPAEWIAEFVRLVEEGQASQAFLEFFEKSPECKHAFETVMRSDEEIAELVRASCRNAVVS